MFKKLNKRAIVIIVAVVAVIALVGGTLAWFVTSSSLSQHFTISGFDVAANVYFDNNGQKIKGSKYADKDGLYILSLNAEDENYVGKLRVDVNHTGGKAYIRVRLNNEWTLADGTVSQYKAALPFVFGSQWYDNRNTDYCVYYRGGDKTGKATFDTSELIKDFDSAQFNANGFVDGVTLKLSVQVDAVQINRYPQIWKIDKLPWK